MSTPMILRDYQQDAISAVLDARAQGRTRTLLALPPGAGKTVIFVSLIDRLAGRAIVLCHRDELVQQAVAKVQMLAPHLSTGIVQGPRNERDADVLVCSVPTLARPHRRAQLPGDLAVVIADECHHAAASTWRTVLEHLQAGEPGGPLLVGVTASPDRADGLGLDTLFGDEAVYEASLLDLIDAGYLSPLMARRVVYVADFSQLQVRAGDVTAGSAERAFLSGGGPSAVAQAIRTDAISRRHILVFTSGIRSADATARVLTQDGIAAAAINGEMPMAERREVLGRFRAGEVRVLVNCMLLTEGVDIPQVDAIVLARPTKSRALYLQMCGRGFRRHPAKTDCLLLDLTANSSRLELVTPASLVGLDPEDVADGESLSIAVERHRQEERAATAVRDVAVTIQSRPIDILRQRPAAWVPVANNRYALPLGDGQIILRRDPGAGDRWSVLESRPHQGIRVLRTELPIDYAMGVGEAYAKCAGAGALTNPRAKWRQDPATPGQLAYLRALGVRVPVAATKGVAQSLIAAAKASRVA